MNSEWNNVQPAYCRLCKGVGGDLHPIDPFVDVVVEMTSLHIRPNDKLSKLVCGTCTEKVESWFEFKKTCQRNQTIVQVHENTDEVVTEAIQVKEEVIEDDDIEILNENVTVKLETLDYEDGVTLDTDLHEKSINDSFKCQACDTRFENKAEFDEHEKRAHKTVTQENPVTNVVKSTPEVTDCVKIQFVSGLGLIERDAAAIEMEKFSAIEISYLQKCKAMADMYYSFKCACHLATHPNLKGLLSHLRSVKIWFPAFTCYNCMISFNGSFLFRKHVHVCPKKNLEGLVQLSEMKKRSQFKARVYQNFRCIKCKIIFTFIEDFCSHICVEHCDVSCMVEYYCDICKIALRSLQEFIEHAKQQHDNSEGFALLDKNTCRKKSPQKLDPKDNSEYSKRKRRSTYSRSASNEQTFDVGQPSRGDKHKLRASVKCQHCHKVYSCRSNMLRHMMQIHQDVGLKNTQTENPDNSIYRCPDCLEMYNAADWEIHKQSHKKLNCSECDELFTFRAELDEHLVNHSKLKVHRDSETSSFEGSMFSPDHGLPYCDICNTLCENFEKLESHKLSHEYLETEGVPIESSKYSCVTCNQNFLNYAAYNDHNAKLHSKRKTAGEVFSSQCDESDEIISDVPEFVNNGTVQRRDRNSSARKSSSRITSSLARSKSRESEKQEKKMYHTCERCLKVFSNKHNLKRHMNIHGIQMSASETSKSSNMFSCDRCQLAFPNPRTLKNHMVEEHRHTSDSVEKIKMERHIFKCDNCNKTFSTKVDLIQHKVDQHVQGVKTSKKYKRHCKYCTLRFKSLKSLKDHMVQVHSRIPSTLNTQKVRRNNKFPCKICRKSFVSQSALNAHSGCHSSSHEQSAKKPRRQSDISLEFQCTKCGWNAPNEIAMKIHTIEKHGEGIPLLTPRCESCNQDFETLADYKNHMELHEILESEEKQKSTISCQFYANSSSKNKSLQAHIKISHPTVPQEFECQYCEKKFDKKGSLNKHVKAHERRSAPVFQLSNL